MVSILIAGFVGLCFGLFLFAIFGSAKEADAWADGYAAGRIARDEERQRA